MKEIVVVVLILQSITKFIFANIEKGGINFKSDENSSAEIQRRLLGNSAVALNYYGGPILTSVHVVPIFYNSDVLYQSNIKTYYNALLTGGDFLSFIDAEYGQGAEKTINFGTVEEPFVGSETVMDISDLQIRNWIEYMFSADPKILPSPSENTLYAVSAKSSKYFAYNNGIVLTCLFC